MTVEEWKEGRRKEGGRDESRANMKWNLLVRKKRIAVLEKEEKDDEEEKKQKKDEEKEDEE